MKEPITNDTAERNIQLDSKDLILSKVHKLMAAYRDGLLGGERLKECNSFKRELVPDSTNLQAEKGAWIIKMPEHENPGLDRASKENYLYFTLPMALNYQRNSYVLWECANRLYKDVPEIFDCGHVLRMSEADLKDVLVQYKVALQPNKQPVIWKTLCATFHDKYGGDVRKFFSAMNYEVSAIKESISRNKKAFPYLGGSKICNYWLYVMEQYTDAKFVDREHITVAPDTHVIQASERLGVISAEEAKRADVQQIVANRWNELLRGTEYVPIDIHTPMWLWSRGKFRTIL
ncbi:MAG: hypothetical protein HDR15_12390 [Lachnospiraceae bacterium]|nr:hypothetical protein [Lachnospiraceae bacterium]